MGSLSEFIEDVDKVTITNKHEDLPYDDYVIISNEGDSGLGILAVDNTDYSVVTTFVDKKDIGKLIKIIESKATFCELSQSWECSATVVTLKKYERNIDLVKYVSYQLLNESGVFHLGVNFIKEHHLGYVYELEWEVE